MLFVYSLACIELVTKLFQLWFWDISHFLQWWSVVWLVPLEFVVWDWRHLWPHCEDIFDCSKSLLYTIVIFVYCNIFVCNIFLWFCFNSASAIYIFFSVHHSQFFASAIYFWVVMHWWLVIRYLFILSGHCRCVCVQCRCWSGAVQGCAVQC